ncbi:MAG: Uncharacterised protein [Hyphomonas sp. TMED17]|nr:MAG: Uncharacterised protein [Hyphomonas sp. TMED17]
MGASPAENPNISRSSGVDSWGVLQCGQRRRTSRCAITALKVAASTYGSIPISRSRCTAPAAEFVCTVDKTGRPVAANSNATLAVSRSRTSPTITTSGSCRKMARKVAAKVRPTLWCIWVWLIPGRPYSIGSSSVMTLRSPLFRTDNAEYKVVVLPEPVGPVTKVMPFGWDRMLRNRIRVSSSMPRSESSSKACRVSSSRIVTRSPYRDGSVDTLTSIDRPPMVSEIRPSCGTRVSAISSLAITFIRLINGAASRTDGVRTSCNTPSIR